MTQAILNENGFAATAGTLTVYTYHPETFEYLGEQTPYISIGTGIPSGCTLTAPPVAEANYVYCWDGENWVKTENHRGETVYNEKDGSPFEIRQLGAKPEGYADTAPPVLQQGQSLGGFNPETQTWIVNQPSQLDKAKQNLANYYQIWNQTYPVGNPPPQEVVNKAKALADWIKEAEAQNNQNTPKGDAS